MKKLILFFSLFLIINICTCEMPKAFANYSNLNINEITEGNLYNQKTCSMPNTFIPPEDESYPIYPRKVVGEVIMDKINNVNCDSIYQIYGDSLFVTEIRKAEDWYIIYGVAGRGYIKILSYATDYIKKDTTIQYDKVEAGKAYDISIWSHVLWSHSISFSLNGIVSVKYYNRPEGGEVSFSKDLVGLDIIKRKNNIVEIKTPEEKIEKYLVGEVVIEKMEDSIPDVSTLLEGEILITEIRKLYDHYILLGRSGMDKYKIISKDIDLPSEIDDTRRVKIHAGNIYNIDVKPAKTKIFFDIETYDYPHTEAYIITDEVEGYNHLYESPDIIGMYLITDEEQRPSNSH